MPKSMTKNKNEVWMAGSTWSSRNLELEMSRGDRVRSPVPGAGARPEGEEDKEVKFKLRSEESQKKKPFS